jgi:phosphatidylinositol glycan class S
VAQLRTLFGLPPTVSDDSKTDTFGVPATARGFADWEVDVLLRRRAVMDVHASASTLASLSRLVIFLAK